jgi:hypothetical protein
MTRRKIRLNAEWPGGSDNQKLDLPDGWDTWPADAREEFLADSAVEFLASSGCSSGGCVVEVDEHDNEIRILDEETDPR